MPPVDRIVAWYRLSSSVGAVVALIVANAVPLIGVLFLGWSVWNILIIYWLENGVVGAYNVLKIARAEGTAETVGGMTVTMNGQPMTSVAKAAMIPFFLLHYGIFWVVHGVFVLTLPFFTGMFAPAPGFADEPTLEPGIPVDDPFVAVGGLGASAGTSTAIDVGWIAFAVLALVISHGLSFWWNFLRGGEYRRVSPGQQMFAPYGRLVALHLTIIFGAMAVTATGAPALAVAILVLAKIVLDLGFHLAEHRKARPATD